MSDVERQSEEEREEATAVVVRSQGPAPLRPATLHTAQTKAKPRAKKPQKKRRKAASSEEEPSEEDPSDEPSAVRMTTGWSPPLLYADARVPSAQMEEDERPEEEVRSGFGRPARPVLTLSSPG